MNEQAYTNYVVKDEKVVSTGLALTRINSQVSELMTTYSQALKDIKRDYPSMSASELLVYMRSRTGETRDLLETYTSLKETAKGDFDMAMKMADGQYDAVSKDIASANVMKNKRAELQMTADFEREQSAQALNDPATQIASTINEFAKL